MGNYTVKVECKIIKEVTCEDCTEAQAKANPFQYAVDEIETDQLDWEVLSIKEDK